MNNKKGFILPLSVLLVLVLGVSGSAFMHLDFLERRMAMNEVDNHGAFYLANAGIERAREVFKMDAAGWTSLLQDPSPLVRDSSPPCLSADPNSCLCPPDLSSGCVIPLFGETVTPPGDLPFDATFDNGQYEVRAFNNDEPHTATVCPSPDNTKDCDGKIIMRAIGTVRGEQKLLEATIRGASGLKLINCDEAEQSTEECRENQDSSSWSSLEGREPTSFLVTSLPHFVQSYYSNRLNFSSLALADCGSYAGVANDNCYYSDTTDISIKNVTAQNVVFFNTKNISVEENAVLTNAIIVGDGVSVGNNAIIYAPTTPILYPAIISTKNVDLDGGSPGPTTPKIVGAVYADNGHIEFKNGNSVRVEGVLIARGGKIKRKDSAVVTDNLNLIYYSQMPGFDYPPGLLTSSQEPGSWREIE